MKLITYVILIGTLVSCSSNTIQGHKGEKIITQNQLCGFFASDICKLQYKNYKKARKVRDILYRNKGLIFTAESLTAGNIATSIGKVSWSSGALAGGVVAYATSVKNSELRVKYRDDAKVMSKQTAREMVQGLSRIAKRVNAQQVKNKKDSRVKLLVAVTGATTTWKDKLPHFFIGIKYQNTPIVVKKIKLKTDLKDTNIEKIYNLELATFKALEYIEGTLNSTQ